MDTHPNLPSPKRLLNWFNPVGRQTSGWAFILNRISALGLTFYLYLHLIVLGQLAKGPEGYDGFLALVQHPVAIAGELLVVAGGVLHGLNGIRILLTTFGIGVTRQKQLFYAAAALAIIITAIFGFRMYSA